MANYVNYIGTYNTDTAYDNDTNKDYPNVSYVIADDEVKWTAAASATITAKYNVITTSGNTTLLASTTNITKMTIDGVEQQNVVSSYQFSTAGEHTVIYEMANGEIAFNTFNLISTLTSVIISDTCTSIGRDAFNNSTNLASVTVMAITPPTLGLNAFQNNASGRKIYVPLPSVSTYQTNWSTYAADIEARPIN